MGTLNIIQNHQEKLPRSDPSIDRSEREAYRPGGSAEPMESNSYSTTREKVENKTRDTEKTIIPNPQDCKHKGQKPQRDSSRSEGSGEVWINKYSSPQGEGPKKGPNPLLEDPNNEMRDPLQGREVTRGSEDKENKSFME